MEWQFSLNDVYYDEPQGFRDLVFKLNRDPVAHGITVEATLSELGFKGEAQEFLTEQKRIYGLKAQVVLKIDYRCDDGEFINAYTGNLDFRSYKRRCGKQCFVLISVEQKGCIMVLKNRFNQKVDLDSPTTFNKTTLLQNYDGLNIDLELPGLKLDARVQGRVIDEGVEDTIPIVDNPDTGAFGVFIRPNYGVTEFNSIVQGSLEGVMNYSAVGPFEMGITPQLLFSESGVCYTLQDFDYTFRFKGILRILANAEGLNFRAKVGLWNATGDFSDNVEVIEDEEIYVAEDYVNNTEIPFDVTITGATNIPEGVGLYAYLEVAAFNTDPQDFDIVINWDKETAVSIVNVKQCPPTVASVKLINEVGSRIVESITDGCLRLKSDYLGRTDSQPIASSIDGCGSNRCLSSGLKIRRADNPTFFLSLQDYIQGITSLDNLGWGIEDDELITGRQWLRIESIEHFYQDKKILTIDHIPDGTEVIDTERCFALIKVGFRRWEVERFNGLDEVNSNKEFRTSLNNIDNVLDVQSVFVGGSLAWEITRNQQFADTGGADTSYDNEPFIICVKRGIGYPYTYGYGSGWEVETDIIQNASNMYSPETVYNWRIRPFYSLMRWAKSIFNCYANLFNSDSKLFFSAGTGNLLARGEMIADDCKIENGPKQENQDLSTQDFANAADYLPVIKTDRLIFKDYPVSVADWQYIKTNLYGYLYVQCGNGSYVKGYIRDMTYNLFRQKASFDLTLKWE